MGRLFRWLFVDVIWTGVVFEGGKWLLLYGWPFVVTVLTFWTGRIIPGIPLPYLIAATAIVLSTSLTAVVRLVELRRALSVSGKLQFAGVRFILEPHRNAKGKPIRLAKGQLEFNLINSSNETISVVWEQMDSSVAGHINQNPPPDIKRSDVPSGSALIYRDHPIDLNMDLEDQVLCKMQFKAKYGAKGNEKYPINKHMTLLCALNRATGVYDQQVPQDVAE